ncbi:TPA: glucosyltransferase domain-containing protein, partial [Escherichia coli]|nr:glucosyltransferase domain-containing protein [Escherichia coli]
MTRQIDFNGICNKVMEYKSCFIAAFLCYCVVYGFELTHFTLSIDEEFGDNFFQTIMLGRWGHGLLKHYILPEPYVPFFTTIISIAFLSIAAGLSAMYLKLGRTHSLAFVIMLASLPQLAYQLEFANQSDTIGVALIFSAASLIAMDAGGKIGWIAFIA